MLEGSGKKPQESAPRRDLRVRIKGLEFRAVETLNNYKS